MMNDSNPQTQTHEKTSKDDQIKTGVKDNANPRKPDEADQHLGEGEGPHREDRDEPFKAQRES